MKNYSTFLKGAGVALMLLLAYLLYEWSALIPYSDYGTERIKNEQVADFLKSGSLLALFAGIIIFSFFVAVYKQYQNDNKVQWAFRIALVGALAIVISSYLRYDLYDTLKSTSEFSKSKIESLQSTSKWIHYLSHGYALLVIALLLAYQSLSKNRKLIMPIIAVCLAVYFQNVSMIPADRTINQFYDTNGLTKETFLMWSMLKIVLLYSSFAFLFFACAQDEKKLRNNSEVSAAEVIAFIALVVAVVFFCKEWAYQKIDVKEYDGYYEYGYSHDYYGDKDKTITFLNGGYSIKWVSLGFIVMMLAAMSLLLRNENMKRRMGLAMIFFGLVAVGYATFGLKFELPDSSEGEMVKRTLLDVPSEYDVKIWKMIVFLIASLVSGIAMLESSTNSSNYSRRIARDTPPVPPVPPVPPTPSAPSTPASAHLEPVVAPTSVPESVQDVSEDVTVVHMPPTAPAVEPTPPPVPPVAEPAPAPVAEPAPAPVVESAPSPSPSPAPAPKAEPEETTVSESQPEQQAPRQRSLFGPGGARRNFDDKEEYERLKAELERLRSQNQ